MDVSIQKNYARSHRIDVFVRGQPVTTERLRLFDEQMCLFRMIMPVPTERCVCLEGLYPLLPKSFLWILYKADFHSHVSLIINLTWDFQNSINYNE